MDRAGEMEREATRDEFMPNCRHCGHAYEEHFAIFEGACSECPCIDYDPDYDPEIPDAD
jgi:hypothetical protein